MTSLPPPVPGTALRILATSDLGAAIVPLRTSYGESGTLAGIVELLERERERGPAIWLDAGDLVVGSPAYPLLGERRWDDVAGLPISAAAAGNHDFDDGVPALRETASRLSFPMLCANLDVGLPPTAMLDTGGGTVGVIGLTHPSCDRFTHAPPLPTGWPERVEPLARDLRGQGARWVVALFHDGVEWWPDDPVATRPDRLDAAARPWAEHVDVILLGHNFGAWVGELAGTAAGEPHLFASSVVLVDVADRPVVRGVFRVPALHPAERSPASEAIDAAGARVVAETAHAWVTRTGAERYLPDLIAYGLRTATGADAGLVLPGSHAVQAPFDGTIAALGPGPVTELDVLRMFAGAGYDPVVVELRPGELRAATAAHWSFADPRNTAADRLWWNWCRMPAGTSAGTGEPASVAVIPRIVRHLSEWLGRDVEAHPTGVSAQEAVIAAVREPDI